MDNRSTRRWLTNELLPRHLNLAGFIRGIAASVKLGAAPRAHGAAHERAHQAGAGSTRARCGIITPFAYRLFAAPARSGVGLDQSTLAA